MAGLPIADFIKTRLKEFDSKFELRAGTAFEQLFLKPLSFILQPLRSEADSIQTAQSALRIMNTGAPDSFDEESVDSIASNVFVYRATGGNASGVVRVYYSRAVDREWPTEGAVFLGNSGQEFYNTSPYNVSAVQMSTQVDSGLYYIDIPVQAANNGTEYNVDVGGVVSLVGDSQAVSVTNLQAFSGGVPRETNTQLIERVRKSIAVRDLVTAKGVNAILFESFPTTLTEIVPVGFGDDEMMRDVVFNTHIGGKVDLYVKTTSVKTSSKDFVGLLIDPTRQTRALVSIQMVGGSPVSLRNPGIDRSGGRAPVIRQVKPTVAASYVSTANLSTSVNLSSSGAIRGKWVNVEIYGYSPRDVNLAGLTPSQTKKQEIIAAINRSFGVDIASSFGNSFKISVPTRGVQSKLVLSPPSSGRESALSSVFGLADGSSHVFFGDGPLEFVEDEHYVIDDGDGTITRLTGPVIVQERSLGKIDTSKGLTYFTDAVFSSDTTSGLYVAVQPNDILTVLAGNTGTPNPDAGDYRILEVSSDFKTLTLDRPLKSTPAAPETSISYTIRRTGIKNNEVVSAEYWFNPLSVDIGKFIPQDDLARVRSVRPGRESATISDVAFIRINRIELIDPLTGESLGQDLQGVGGYGSGGYGKGPYGIGSKKDYYLVVNSPSDRYSAFEDSYIVINSAYQGFSFRVHYDYAPDIETVHNFARSANERVLDGDTLVKHFIPAYVSGTLEYRVDPSVVLDIPTNDELLDQLKTFINTRPAGATLEYSDITQFILRKTDPYDRYGTFIRPFALKATIYNTDGSTNILSGADKLQVKAPSPFPKYTVRPLSPRIVHWMADNIELVRLD